ncbi:unnamed protein product [Urochloa humidicola]
MTGTLIVVFIWFQVAKCGNWAPKYHSHAQISQIVQRAIHCPYVFAPGVARNLVGLGAGGGNVGRGVR